MKSGTYSVSLAKLCTVVMMAIVPMAAHAVDKAAQMSNAAAQAQATYDAKKGGATRDGGGDVRGDMTLDHAPPMDGGPVGMGVSLSAE